MWKGNIMGWTLSPQIHVLSLLGKLKSDLSLHCCNQYHKIKQQKCIVSQSLGWGVQVDVWSVWFLMKTLFWLAENHFLTLSPHSFIWCLFRFFLITLIRPPVLLDWDINVVNLFNLSYLLKCLFPNSITLGIRASTNKYRGDIVPFIATFLPFIH